MLSAGSCALLLETVLFLALAAVSGWEYLRSRQQSVVPLEPRRGGGGGGRGGAGGGSGGQSARRGREAEMTLLQAEEAESDNNGTRARHRINIILALACTARALLTVYVAVTRSAWVPYLAVPDLCYIALYCSLTFLLAELRQIIVVSKARHFAIKAAVRWGFGGVLLVSLAVCSLRWGTDPESTKSLVLRKFLYFELGVTYLVMLVAFLYFGVRVCVCMAAPNKRLFYRLLVLTFVCGAGICTKGTFFVIAAVNNSQADALFPGSMGRDRFEALIALEELLPSIAVAYLTARGKGRRHRAQQVYVRPTENTMIAGWSNPSRLYSSSISININSGRLSPPSSLSSTPGARNVLFYGSPA